MTTTSQKNDGVVLKSQGDTFIQTIKPKVVKLSLSLESHNGCTPRSEVIEVNSNYKEDQSFLNKVKEYQECAEQNNQNTAIDDDHWYVAINSLNPSDRQLAYRIDDELL